MAIIAAQAITLAEWAKRLDPDGKPAVIIEMLSQVNEILNDIKFMEGNLPTGHRVTMRTGLPTVAWKLINQGVVPSKSSTAQVDEQVGTLQGWSEPEKDLADLGGNSDAFRLSEGMAFVEAMSQEMARTLFYGNSLVNPERFTGLAPRYSSLSAQNGKNIVDGKGTGANNTSIWLLCWGDQSMYGMFPKGSQVGLQHKDFGEQVIETGADIGPNQGRRMEVYRDKWEWKAGLCLKDWRYGVRIPNIDITEMARTANPRQEIIKLMIMATHRIHIPDMARCVWYMNRTAFQELDIERFDKVVEGGGMNYMDIDGKRVPSFRGAPIRLNDAIINEEGRVT